MSVFRRRRANKKGVVAPDGVYNIEFRDHLGIVRRVAAFADKSASRELERNLMKLVALRMAGAGPDVELLRVLESCPVVVRDRLAEWGIITGERAAAGKPITEHIADWLIATKAKGSSEKHGKRFASYAKKLAVSCKWKNLTDISSDDVNVWVAGQRQAGPSASTINAVLRAGKAFCGWAVKAKRLTENPLKHVALLNEKADRRVERHPYDVDELGLLLAAAIAGKTHHGLTGYERSLVYRLAVGTGFRHSEIRSLNRASFNFATTPATVFLEAKHAKNGEDATQPLPPELAADLKAYMALFLPTARAFRMWGGKGAAMIREDLEAAGILKRDADGKLIAVDECGLSFDFHGLRHTFATMGAKAGIPLAVMQKLMRHSDPRLTAGIYTHIMVADKADELAKLPTIAPAATKTALSIFCRRTLS